MASAHRQKDHSPAGFTVRANFELVREHSGSEFLPALAVRKFSCGADLLWTMVYRFDYLTGLSRWPAFASENAGWPQGLLEGRDT